MKRDKFEIFMYVFILIFAVLYLVSIAKKQPSYGYDGMTVEEQIRIEQMIW